jgi:hypothetical protein
MIPSMKQPWRTIFDIAVLAALSPFAWMIADREPPWVRLYGTIAPTHAGGEFNVEWHTTPLVRECGGYLQVEILSGMVVWPVLRRQINPNLNVGQTTYKAPPWPLPLTVPPGKATYRVTSFWFCNSLQEYLGWPIIQVGPDIEFEVLRAMLPPTVPTPDWHKPPERGPQGEQGIQGERGPPGENAK